MDQNTKTQDPKILIAKLLSLCLKNWKLFAVCLVCTCALAGTYLLIRTPKYEVDAQLMLPPESSSGGIMALSDIASSFSMGDMFGGSSTDNEIAVMRSHSVFLQTVKNLGLNVSYFEKQKLIKWEPVYLNQQLVLTANPSLGDTIRTSMRFDVKLLSNGNFNIKVIAKKKTILEIKDTALPTTIDTQYGTFLLDKTANFGVEEDAATSFRILYGSYSAAAQTYLELVKIFNPNKKTDFIDLSFITNTPAFGKRLLNTIIDNYNLLYNDQKNDKNQRSLEFIDNRLNTLTRELTQSENAMEAFKKEHQLTDVQVDASQALELSTRSENALLQANLEHEFLQMTYDYIHNPENKYSLIPNMTTSASASLSASTDGSTASDEIDNYNDLIIRHMRLSQTVQPNHTQIKLLEEQIDMLRENINKTIAQSLTNSQIKINELQKQNNKAKSRIGSIPALEKDYISIERTLMLQQQLYLFLLKQREETSMSLAKVNPQIITIDEPYVLKDKPGLSDKMVAALAIFLGLLIPLVFVYFFKLGKAPLWSTSEIANGTDAPFAGEIAFDASQNDLPVLSSTDGETIRQLSLNVRFFLEGCQGKAIMVASAINDEGKTYVATNLAASLALIGSKTLIIDANIANQGVGKVFGLGKNEPGLVELSKTSADVRSLIRKVNVNGYELDVLCGGNPAGVNGADIVGSDNVSKALNEIKNDYDFIVVDTPDMESNCTAYALADFADITLLVLRAKLSTPAQEKLANTLYAEGRLPRIAIVANS